MGRKHDAVLATEPVAEAAEEEALLPNSPELKSEKKKKKKNKNKREHNQNETTSPKRKLDELHSQNDAESNEKKKKKKKHKRDSKENVEETEAESVDGGGGGDESVTDGLVVVTGKNAGDAKYAPVKSFAGSGLPDNVLECCKGFEKPSPIQSRAWPFLLDGRDLIGIAATGSGALLLSVCVCVRCCSVYVCVCVC